MNKRKLWLIAATLGILLQAYMFPVLISAVPSILAACIMITAVYFSPRTLIVSAFIWGLLLDTASANGFGFHVFIAVTTAGGLWWLLRRGLDNDSLFNVVIMMVLAVAWQNLASLVVSGWPLGVSIDAGKWLAISLWQMAGTVIFAWFINRSVKLKVWARY